jgi:hypothetical protein
LCRASAACYFSHTIQINADLKVPPLLQGWVVMSGFNSRAQLPADVA